MNFTTDGVNFTTDGVNFTVVPGTLGRWSEFPRNCSRDVGTLGRNSRDVGTLGPNSRGTLGRWAPNSRDVGTLAGTLGRWAVNFTVGGETGFSPEIKFASKSEYTFLYKTCFVYIFFFFFVLALLALLYYFRYFFGGGCEGNRFTITCAWRDNCITGCGALHTQCDEYWGAPESFKMQWWGGIHARPSMRLSNSCDGSHFMLSAVWFQNSGFRV